MLYPWLRLISRGSSVWPPRSRKGRDWCWSVRVALGGAPQSEWWEISLSIALFCCTWGAHLMPLPPFKQPAVDIALENQGVAAWAGGGPMEEVVPEVARRSSLRNGSAESAAKQARVGSRSPRGRVAAEAGEGGVGKEISGGVSSGGGNFPAPWPLAPPAKTSPALATHIRH